MLSKSNIHHSCSWLNHDGRSLSVALSRGLFIAMMLLSATANMAWAQRNLRDIPEPDPDEELKQFEIAEGFEANLFASSPHLAKPIQMNFDERGRLWVASSEVYPQIAPGQVANDKVLVLEDKDGDGVAEAAEVYADGLLVPTGVLPGDGGCYVANSTELVHLTDTDGDGRADQRRVVLSGFGTEDTHHILHTLRWGPDGALYMNQSIYIHSHIETPYGVKRMNGSGVWRWEPDTLRLETFTLGLVNPWGHAWNRFGVSFETDGAGGEGINYVFPGFVGMTSPGAARILHGLNPGKPKLCGLEIVGGSALPESWQGNLITNDFRAHRVCRYVVEEEGSGYKSEELEELIRTRHVAFRPIDVKMGPDGAIYIADWYNPIIQHGEVDFRDPRRDHVNGRIWRVTAKGHDTIPRLDLRSLPNNELFTHLVGHEPWRKMAARMILRERGAAIIPDLQRWVGTLSFDSADSEQAGLEALWVFQSLRRCPVNLVRKLHGASEPGVRAAANRALYHWHGEVADALKLLEAGVRDVHPRVRLEAVRALSRVPQARACEIAMLAVDQPMDRFLEYSTWLTARELEPYWLPALQAGEIDFDGQAEHLAFAIQSVQSGDVGPLLVTMLENLKSDDASVRETILGVLSSVGDAQQLGRVLSEIQHGSTEAKSRLLKQLVESSRRRRVVPQDAAAHLKPWLVSDSNRLRQAAVTAVGIWRVESLVEDLIKLVVADDRDERERAVAIDAIARVGNEACRSTLDKMATGDGPDLLRIAAAAGIARFDTKAGAERLAETLHHVDNTIDPSSAVLSLLSVRGAADEFASALGSVKMPRDVAMLAVRAVESSGRQEPAVLAALREAGDLAKSPWNLDDQARRKLIEDAITQGNPHEGEQVYRRAALSCQKCHAIGNAGGKVGPDLASVGASAQPDYLLESLLEPGKKIKENYHSLIVETDEGLVVTGIKLRETQTDLILRDAEDRELRVPLASIEERTDGGSLMPAGLADQLTRDELQDLLKYLSELGKVGGDFALPRENYVRTWQVLEATAANQEQLRDAGRLDHLVEHAADYAWSDVYSRVAGDLTLQELPVVSVGSKQVTIVRFPATQFGSATRAIVNRASGVIVWVDDEPVSDGVQGFDKPVKSEWIIIAIESNDERDASLKIELR